MSKRKIGKAQLIIGIIVLILGIAGLITSWIWFDNGNERFMRSLEDNSLDQVKEDCLECSDVEINIVALERVNLEVSLLSSLASAITSLAVLSILFILISLLFITQGLVNSSEIR